MRPTVKDAAASPGPRAPSSTLRAIVSVRRQLLPPCSPARSWPSAAGAGSDDSYQQGAARSARPSEFPRPTGKTARAAGQEPRQGGRCSRRRVVLPPGHNRFGFGLFRPRAQADRRRHRRRLHRERSAAGEASGPFVAHFRVARGQAAIPEPDDDSRTRTLPSRSTWPTCRSRSPGATQVLGMARLDDRLVAATSRGSA